jgi:hypothetical protein
VSNGTDKDQFQEYLDGDSPVSRRYAELDEAGPSPELDAAILASARRAVNSGPVKSTGQYRRWMAPLSLAATVMLVVSLALNVLRETPSVPAPAKKNRTAMKDESTAVMSEKALPESAAFADRVTASAAQQLESKKIVEEVETQSPTRRMMSPMSAPNPSGRMYAADADIRQDLTGQVKIIDDYFKSIEGAPSSADAEVMSIPMAREQAVSPSATLRSVAELYAAGEYQRATEILVEFRAEFPDHPVSLALKEYPQ